MYAAGGVSFSSGPAEPLAFGTAVRCAFTDSATATRWPSTAAYGIFVFCVFRFFKGLLAHHNFTWPIRRQSFWFCSLPRTFFTLNAIHSVLFSRL